LVGLQRNAQKDTHMMDMKSMEYQMDGLYSILQARHIEVLGATYNPKHRLDLPKLKNISECMGKALDMIQHCSEEFEILKANQQNWIGRNLAAEAAEARGWTVNGKPIASDGPTGETFNPLHD
jgi:hypothetical protein